MSIYKNAFLALTLILLFNFAFAVAPVVTSSRTVPTGNITIGDVSIIKGYCTATDSDSLEVMYWYEWYANSSLKSNGSFGNVPGTQQNATPDVFGYTGTWTTPEAAEDNDYLTFATHAANAANYSIYYNYSASIPAGLTSATWQVKHGTRAIENLTLSSACYLQTPIRLGMWSHRSGNTYSSRPMCYDGLSWVNIGTLSSSTPPGGYIYDQDIYFGTPMKMYPQGVEQNVNNITSGFEGEWYLECVAQDLDTNSTKLDSGKLNVTDSLEIAACQNLNVTNMLYNLTTDIDAISSNVCFNSTADNVTLDCKTYNMTGQNNSGSFALFSNSTNSTFFNCTIHSFETGMGFSSTSQICNSTENNITANFWINNQGTNNVFNTSTKGNIYHLSTDAGAWTKYDITAASPPGWADGGADRPFTSALLEWTGSGSDYHPWTENSGSLVVDTTLNCTTFSFGTNLDPGTSDNPAIGNPPCLLTNTGNSNTAVDVYLNASNMTSGGNWISFRSLSVWNSNDAGSSIMMNATNMDDGIAYLNSTAPYSENEGFYENLAILGTVNFYFWQDVPVAQPLGSYSAKITFHSVADGLIP